MNDFSKEQLRALTDEGYRANGCYPIQSEYHIKRHDWVLERISGADLLVDLGCGDGTLGRRALETGSIQNYHGLDFSDSALQLADRNLRHLCGKYTLTLGDAEDTYHTLPLPLYSADVVTVVEVLEHTRHPRRVLGGACHLLAGDGTLFVTTPWKRDRHDPLEINHMGYEEIRMSLERNRVLPVETGVLYTDEREVPYTNKESGCVYVKTYAARPLTHLLMSRRMLI